MILAGLVLIYAFARESKRMKFVQQIIQTTVSSAISVVAGKLGMVAA